jgi:hypothetical protein
MQQVLNTTAFNKLEERHNMFHGNPAFEFQVKRVVRVLVVIRLRHFHHAAGADQFFPLHERLFATTAIPREKQPDKITKNLYGQ